MESKVRYGEVLTHEKQASTTKTSFRHSHASSITLVRLSILMIRSTSRTLCFFFARILHRKTLAISLKASYVQIFGLVARERPPRGEMLTYKEIEAQSQTESGYDGIESIFLVVRKIVFVLIDLQCD